MAFIIKVQELDSLTAPAGKTVLNTLEDHGVAVEYQCRQGYCGACQIQLVDGTVTYNEPPLAFIRDGYVLSCCCQPQTDLIIRLPWLSSDQAVQRCHNAKTCLTKTDETV